MHYVQAVASSRLVVLYLDLIVLFLSQSGDNDDFYKSETLFFSCVGRCDTRKWVRSHGKKSQKLFKNCKLRLGDNYSC